MLQLLSTCSKKALYVPNSIHAIVAHLKIVLPRQQILHGLVEFGRFHLETSREMDKEFLLGLDVGQGPGKFLGIIVQGSPQGHAGGDNRKGWVRGDRCVGGGGPVAGATIIISVLDGDHALVQPQNGGTIVGRIITAETNFAINPVGDRGDAAVDPRIIGAGAANLKHGWRGRRCW